MFKECAYALYFYNRTPLKMHNFFTPIVKYILPQSTYSLLSLLF